MYLYINAYENEAKENQHPNCQEFSNANVVIKPVVWDAVMPTTPKKIFLNRFICQTRSFRIQMWVVTNYNPIPSVPTHMDNLRHGVCRLTDAAQVVDISTQINFYLWIYTIALTWIKRKKNHKIFPEDVTSKEAILHHLWAISAEHDPIWFNTI